MANGYDYRKYAVVYADDEEQSLKYFRKAFEKDFRVLTAPSAAGALEILSREGDRIGVLVTDQRMPGKTGVELLAEVRRSRPGIVRLLTTAYSDLDSAIEAVNSGAIYQYVTKPWNLRDLRGQLLRAMELFLLQQERDFLLREKLSALQRVLVTDRVRSFAVMAGGLAHHIRNSMTALRAFLDLAPVRSPEDSAVSGMIGEAFRENLWALAVEESQRVLRMVQQVVDYTVEPSPVFDTTVSLGEIAGRGGERARGECGVRGDAIRVEVDPGLPPFKADRALLERLFSLLLARMIRLGGFDPMVSVRAEERISVWDVPGVRVEITGRGPAWSEDLISSFFTVFAPTRDDPNALGLDLLSAFFIAHHHGGNLIVHRDRPLGPGFELQLPFDPEAAVRPTLEDNCMEKLFTRFEDWDNQRVD